MVCTLVSARFESSCCTWLRTLEIIASGRPLVRTSMMAAGE